MPKSQTLNQLSDRALYTERRYLMKYLLPVLFFLCFGLNQALGQQTFTVTQGAGNGNGSLFWAIQQANNNGVGMDNIRFTVNDVTWDGNIDITSNINIDGGANKVQIESQGNGFEIANGGDGTEIMNCVITNCGGNGIECNNVQNISIHDNCIYGNTGAGIWMPNTDLSTIESNFIGCDENGILNGNGGRGIDFDQDVGNSHDNTIEDNVIVDNGRGFANQFDGHGIYIVTNCNRNTTINNYVGILPGAKVGGADRMAFNAGNGITYANNCIGGLIERNVVSSGLRTNTSSITLYGVSDIIATNNWVGTNDLGAVFNSSDVGIFAAAIENCVISDNVVRGTIGPPTQGRGYGIYVQMGFWNSQIIDNQVFQNDSYGILIDNDTPLGFTPAGRDFNNRIDSEGSVISGNNVYENGASGQAGGIGTINSDAVTITGNTIDNNTGNGLSLISSGNNTVGGGDVGDNNSNTITNNSENGVLIVTDGGLTNNPSEQNVVQGNTIAENDGDGVSIGEGAGNDLSIRNYITENSITCNGTYIGIDLNGGLGNDDYPVPTIDPVSTRAEFITGTGIPGDEVEVFDNRCDCEGEIYLGTAEVRPDGTWEIPVPGTSPVIDSSHVTATQHSRSNTADPYNTSPFTSCCRVNVDSISPTEVAACGGDNITITIWRHVGMRFQLQWSNNENGPWNDVADADVLDGNSLHIGEGDSTWVVGPPGMGQTIFYRVFATSDGWVTDGVVNNDECTAISQIVEVTSYPEVDLSTDPTPPTCGNEDGEVTITVSSGTPNFTFLIDTTGATAVTNTASPFTFTGLGGGTYQFFVTDANGCIDSITQSLNSAQGPRILALDFANDSCDRDLGSITVTSTDPTTGLQYGIGNPPVFGTNNNFTGLSEGDYLITVQDASGCSHDTLISLSDSPIPRFDVADTVNTTCGLENGSITIGATGGTAPYLYSDDNVDFNNVVLYDNLDDGTYTFYVRDSKGCENDTSVTIIDAPGPELSVNTTDPTCGASDGSIAASVGTAGTPDFTYSLTGQPDQVNDGDFTNLTSGTYLVSVTDANGCMDTMTVQLNSAGGPSFTIDTIHPNCGNADGSITFTGAGGVRPLVYSIDLNGTVTTLTNDSVFDGLGPGTYDLTVSNSDGSCPSTGQVTLTDSENPSVSFTSVDPICDSANGSFIAIVSGGTAPYTYSTIGTGAQNDSSYTGLSDGNYTVTIVDANGCEVTGDTTLSPNPGPDIDTVSTTNPLCGQSDGNITIVGTGGTAPLTYWFDSADVGTQVFFDDLGAGNYTFHVFDDNGCWADMVVSLSNSDGPVIDSVSVTHETCSASNGEVTIHYSGGTEPILVNFDGQGEVPDVTYSGLGNGLYSFYIIDDHDCQAPGEVTINNSPGPQITELLTDPVCVPDNGSINLSTQTGTSPFQYSIYNGDSLQDNGDFNFITAGNYDLYIIDDNGCEDRLSVTLNGHPAPVIDPFKTDVSCGLQDGMIDANLVSGPNTPINYTLTGVGTNSTQGSEVFNNLGAGTYTLTVVDSRNCQVDTVIELTTPNGPQIQTLDTVNQHQCDVADGAVTVNATATSTTLSLIYQISGGGRGESNTTGVFTDLEDGIRYTFTVTYSDGTCPDTISTVLTEPGPPRPIGITYPESCEGTKGSIEISNLIPNSEYMILFEGNDYSHNNLENTDELGVILIENIGTGTYDNFEITPPNNCDTTMPSLFVDKDRNCPIVIPNVFTPNDDEVNDRFRIFGIEHYREAVLRIYNRWGNVVYQYKAEKDGEYEGWDGNKERGGNSMLPVGTYYFELDLHQRDELSPIPDFYAGDVTLLR